MIGQLDSTRPVVAFILAVLVCLIGVGVAIYERLHPEELPDRYEDKRCVPTSPVATPQARTRR